MTWKRSGHYLDGPSILRLWKKNGTKTFKHGRALNYNFPLVKFAMAWFLNSYETEYSNGSAERLAFRGVDLLSFIVGRPSYFSGCEKMMKLFEAVLLKESVRASKIRFGWKDFRKTSGRLLKFGPSNLDTYNDVEKVKRNCPVLKLRSFWALVESKWDLRHDEEKEHNNNYTSRLRAKSKNIFFFFSFTANTSHRPFSVLKKYIGEKSLTLKLALVFKRFAFQKQIRSFSL